MEHTMDAQKPDWFALTESDGAPRPAPKNRSKKPMAALLLVGVVLAGGGFIASAEEDDDDYDYQAKPISITSMVDSPESADALDPATAEVARTTVTNTLDPLTPPAFAPITNVAPRGDDDDDDDDHERGERRGHRGDRDRDFDEDDDRDEEEH